MARTADEIKTRIADIIEKADGLRNDEELDIDMMYLYEAMIADLQTLYDDDGSEPTELDKLVAEPIS